MGYQEHYDTLLAEHYNWMFRIPFDQKVLEQKELLVRSGISKATAAVDLGAGSGFQSFALLEIGYERVTAIDTSSQLLNELATRDRANRIKCIQCDMRLIANQLSEPVELAICMGDTLTHLNHLSEVDDLVRDIGQCLKENGSVVLSWRNLTEIPKGVGRFIPVNSSADRIMTCFLEDAGDKVVVHDLIHVRNGSSWEQKCSAYEKIKLSSTEVRSILEVHGFCITSEITVNGMITLAAKKAA